MLFFTKEIQAVRTLNREHVNNHQKDKEREREREREIDKLTAMIQM